MFKQRTIKILLTAWLVTGAASFFFFLKRNDFGSYTHWSTYNDLYPAKGIDADQETTWQECRSQYSKEELAAGKKLSETEAGINENDPALTKTIKLGKWIINSLWNCKTGRPPDSVDRLRPIAILKTVQEEKTKVWCGTYGSLFLFFSSCNGITCRYIESIGKTDGHVINESYIPELKRWIMVDLTHKIIAATDSSGNYLNTVDIKNIYRNEQSRNVNVLYVKNNTSAIVAPADSVNTEWKFYLGDESILRYYHLIYLKKVYKTTEKLKRYFLPDAWYEIYAAEKKPNTLFFIRGFITLIWLLLSIFIFLKFIKPQKTT